MADKLREWRCILKLTISQFTGRFSLSWSTVCSNTIDMMSVKSFAFTLVKQNMIGLLLLKKDSNKPTGHLVNT